MEYKLDNPIAERKTKTVYREDNKTIKLFIENYSVADILNEALNLERVSEGTNLKIPKLLEVSKIKNRWAIITEYIEGETLESLMKTHSDKMDEYLKLFIEIQLKVQSQCVSMLNRMKEKYKHRIQDANNISEYTKFELLQRLLGMESHKELCHGDFDPSNIVINEKNEYYIIDWAHVTSGNGAGDCAQTYLSFAINDNIELADKYLNKFVEMSEIGKSDIQGWLPIIAAKELAKKPEEQDILKKWISVVEYQ